MTFAISSVCGGFAMRGVGTKVLQPGNLIDAIVAAVAAHDKSEDSVEGQHFLMLSPACVEYVSAGVGLRRNDPVYYVVREHRGRCEAFLKREYAAEATAVAAVVYTAAAYRTSPQVTIEEATRVASSSHVIVAVLAFAGPKAPLTPHRFVANLAGGNKEALGWGADEIRQKADEIIKYDNEWCVVSD